MLPIYAALAVIAVGVVVLVVRAMGSGGPRRPPPPPDDFGLRKDPFGAAPVKLDGPRGSPFDPPGTAADVAGPDDALRAALLPLLVRGDKIGAIKLYRERTGASLSEAKNVVESWAPHVAKAAAVDAPLERPVTPRLTLAERDALLADCATRARTDKIDAIKRWRAATGASLRATKDLIDALAANGLVGLAPATLAAACPPGLDATPPSASSAPAPYVPPSRERFEPEPIDDLELAKLLVECKRLAHAGDKIAAIKLYRERTGAGLKDAKDAVERVLES